MWGGGVTRGRSLAVAVARRSLPTSNLIGLPPMTERCPFESHPPEIRPGFALGLGSFLKARGCQLLRKLFGSCMPDPLPLSVVRHFAAPGQATPGARSLPGPRLPLPGSRGLAYSRGVPKRQGEGVPARTQLFAQLLQPNYPVVGTPQKLLLPLNTLVNLREGSPHPLAP